MEISKNSQTYKFVEKWWDSAVPMNLCPFVRRVMYTYVIFTVLAFLCGLTFGLAPIMTGAAFYQYLFNDIPMSSHGPFGMWYFFMAIEACIMAVFAYFYITEETKVGEKVKEVTEEYFEPIIKATKTIKEKSIIWQWFKAKHEKICPKLEFTE